MNQKEKDECNGSSKTQISPSHLPNYSHKNYSSESKVGVLAQLSCWWSSNILFSGLQRPVEQSRDH